MVEEKQGLACIFGGNGTGKSSLLRYTMDEYADDAKYRTAFLTRVDDLSSPFALTKRLCAQFEIPDQRSLAAQNSRLEDYLLEQDEAGRTTVVCIDEGQDLSFDMLNVIRNLLNFETPEYKLIQVIVAGQMELRDKLARQRARAFTSRIFSPVIMQPLSSSETPEMIRFRCERVRVPCPFTDAAMVFIHESARGVPRDILQLCLRATKQFPHAMIDANHIATVIDRAAPARVKTPDNTAPVKVSA